MGLMPAVGLVVSLFGGTPDWVVHRELLAKSTVEIANDKGLCTGLIINTQATHEKEPVDYVLTAAHCDGEHLFVDQAPARVISKDSKKDLMVVAIPRTGRPAIRLAKENPKQGEEVASFGYGYGLERPMLRVSHIADDNTYIPEGGIGGPLIVTDITFVEGMSGGPVINAAGELVMIVQMGTSKMGMGAGAEVIKAKMGRYFEKAPVK